MTRTNKPDRRRFLLGAAAMAAAASIGGRMAQSATAQAAGAAPPALSLGLNLAGLDRELASDAATTLAQVRSIGFRHVEFAGASYLGANHAELRRILEGEGLAAQSMHAPLNDFLDRPARLVAIASQLGCCHIVLSGVERALRRPEGWHAVADMLNGFGVRARRAGVTPVYLHHGYEFMPFEPQDSSYSALDFLIEMTDPALVDFELAPYWAQQAGADTAGLLARHPGRFRLCLARDRASDGRSADIGDGEIDFLRLLSPNMAAGLEKVFVDTISASPMRSAARGRRALSQTLV